MRSANGDLLDRFTRAVDACQRYLRGIEEFSNDPQCLYRISLGTAPRDTVLPDGTSLKKGEPVGLLHLWGEHLPAIPIAGPDLAWGKEMSCLLTKSMKLLAGHVKENSALKQVAAIGNDVFLPFTRNYSRVLERLGFTFMEKLPTDTLLSGVRTKVLQRWTWLLRRAFNYQSSVKHHPYNLTCRPMWISRRLLLEKYLDTQESGSQE